MSTPITTIVSGLGQPNRYGITKIAGDGTVSYDFNFNVDQSDYLPRVNLDASGVLADNLDIYQNDVLVGSRGVLNFEDGPGLVFSVTDDGSFINVMASANAGSGTGDVGGPSSAFDNALARFDGTSGKLIQNSRSFLDDLGVLTVSGLIVTNGNVSGIFIYGNGSNLTGITTSIVSEGSNQYYTDERVDDRVASLIQNGTGITWSYNDGAGTLTPTISTAPSGDVFGPTSSFDNALARFDTTTGKLIQNSRGILDDNGIITASGFVTTLGSISGLMGHMSGIVLYGHTGGVGPSLHIITPPTDNTASTQIRLQSQVNPVGDTFTVSKMGSIAGTQLSLQSSTLTGVNKIIQTASTSTYLTTSTGVLSWSNDSTNASAGQVDLKIHRDASGVLKVLDQANNAAGVSGYFIGDGSRITGLTTNIVSEGSNQYYTDERVDDRVASLIQNGTGITWSYNDGLGTLTPTVSVAPSGDVFGPSSSFDNAIARFDTTTGKLIQNSRGLIDDNGVLTASGIVVTHGSISGVAFYGNGSNLTGLDATDMADGSVSNTEFQYLNGVSSNIQTQIDNKFTKYWVNVKDFGAVGNGVADDSQAFASGLQHIFNLASTITKGPGAGFVGISAKMYVPYGQYRIMQNAALTPPSGFVTSLAGLQICGDGPYNSRIIYDYNGSLTDRTKYLLNGTNNIAYFSMEDISFAGASGTQYGILLHQDNVEGRTQQGLFKRVFFTNFKVALHASGTINVDSYKYLDCLFHGFPSGTTAIYIDNEQSVHHDFISTDFIVIEGTGTMINAGGAIRFFGGSHIAEDNGILLVANGIAANNGINNEEVSYFGTRFELLDTSKLLDLATTKTISYNDVSLTTIQSTNDHLRITTRGQVYFNKSFINDDFKVKITTDLTESYTAEYLPNINFRDCMLSKQLNDFVTITSSAGSNEGGYGRATAEGCKLRTTTYPENKYPIDGNLGSQHGSFGGTFKLVNYNWANNPTTEFGLPIGDAGGNFQSGIFKLPYGSTIRRIAIERVNQNATWGGTAFTHRVYNNDRSIMFVHCSGHPANVAQSFFSADLNYRIDSEAKRTIQVLGSGGAGALPGVGGRIFVEYF